MNTAEEARLVIFETTGRPVQVRLEGETVWLTQRQMAEVLDTSIDNIGLHLRYIRQELVGGSTTEDFSVVQSEGECQVNRRLKHHNVNA